MEKFGIKRKIITMSCFLVIGYSSLLAQEKKTLKIEKDTYSQKMKTENTRDSIWSASLGAGYKNFKGIGIYDIGFKVGRSLNLGHRIQLEYSYRTSARNYRQNWGKYKMNMDSQIGSHMLGLSYDYFPFVANAVLLPDWNSWWIKQLKSLKIKGGVTYMQNPNYNFEASLVDPIYWGNTSFTVAEVGTVQTKISTNKVQPFLGLGYDGFYTGKKLTITVEGGFLYQGKPQVTMIATNMLEPTKEVAPILEHNLADYKIIPFVQVHLQLHLN